MKAQAKLVGFRWSGSNPFLPGEGKTAIAELLNPTEHLFPFKAELYFDKPKVASSGTIFFNLEAGESRPIHFPVTMPSMEGTFPVFLDLFSDDQQIAAYQAREDVVIQVALPEGIYPGMPPPEGWKWTRAIDEQEIRAAQTRAASTEETVLEALLVLYGEKLPVVPTIGNKLISIVQGPSEWTSRSGYTERGLSFIVTYETTAELKHTYPYPSWGMALAKDGGVFVHSNPENAKPLGGGRYETFVRAMSPFPWGGYGPGEWEVTVNLFLQTDGQIAPVQRQTILTGTRTVTVK